MYGLVSQSSWGSSNAIFSWISASGHLVGTRLSFCSMTDYVTNLNVSGRMLPLGELPKGNEVFCCCIACYRVVLDGKLIRLN